MGMQTDVLSAHLHDSGFIVIQQPSRIKAVSVKGNSITASQFDLFSTLTVPVSATYAQSGTTITVTKAAHGLATGDLVGIAFSEGTGGDGFSGNYTITVTNSSTFTITSPNTATVTAGADCSYVSGDGANWLLTLEFEIGDTYQNYFLLPGEGIRSSLKTYALLDGVAVATVFYG
jgi:hypothetical protein